MDRETLKIPKLVNPDNFKITITPEVKKFKWNLNKILLILFVIFLIVFLCISKYSTFEEEPVPYSLVYNFKEN